MQHPTESLSGYLSCISRSSRVVLITAIYLVVFITCTILFSLMYFSLSCYISPIMESTPYCVKILDTVGNPFQVVIEKTGLIGQMSIILIVPAMIFYGIYGVFRLFILVIDVRGHLIRVERRKTLHEQTSS